VESLKFIIGGIIMKKLLTLALAILALNLITSCSDSTSTSKDASVSIVGELATAFVNKIISEKGYNQIQDNEVDSIKITRIRVLMSRMKLYRDVEDTTEGKELKTGPFVYDIDGTGKLFQLASGTVPVGIYDKIKFEFHRFSSSEASQYASDAILKDFATADRYSMIIEGISYKNNTPTNFVFNSQATANLLLKFQPYIDLSEGSSTTISIQLNPNLFFKKGSSILDPSISKNANDIENAIKNTIKALKK
jgi:hypothetical protein